MHNGFIEIKYPAVRQFTADIGRLAREKHTIRAFLEVDVTDALQQIKSLRTPDRKVSFFAWFVKVLADTVACHPPINGIKKAKNTVIVFEQVDISIVVEKQVDDTTVPLPLVLRAVNSKSTFQVTEEIQNAVAQTIDDQNSPMIGAGDNQLLVTLGLIMPQWLRLFVMRTFILHNPDRMQKTMGTVMVTSLGTVGHIPSWIMPTSIHPLSIGIGTLTKKPSWVQGKIQPRQILHLTLSMDHDFIDGMPARKFVADLVQRLNQGYALSDLKSHQI